MWVFLGFPVGGLEGWNGGPQTSPIGGYLVVSLIEFITWGTPSPRQVLGGFHNSFFVTYFEVLKGLFVDNV